MIRLFTQKLSTGMLTHRAVENVRFISQTSRILEKSPATKTPAETPTPTSQPAAEAASGSSSAAPWQKTSQQRKLSGYDKRILVWTGKFKSIDEVPPTVSHETLDRARDKFRVKSCLWMMVACTIICIVQIVRGKQAAERGESVVKANLEWHREYNEAARKNEAQSK